MVELLVLISPGIERPYFVIGHNIVFRPLVSGFREA